MRAPRLNYSVVVLFAGMGVLALAARFVGLQILDSDKKAAPPAADNIARGRPYTLDPAPNHAGCMDADRRLLTDGRQSNGGGALWLSEGAAGWEMMRLARIRVDLGSVQSIGGASLHTGAGAAQVEWPMVIDLLVSDDGVTYRFVGNLVELDLPHGEPPSSGYATHRYWTYGLAARGRYVMYAYALAYGAYGFVDEVEVYRGPTGALPGMEGAETTSDPQSYVEARLQRQLARMRLLRDADAVRSEARELPRETGAPIPAALDAITAAMSRGPVSPDEPERPTFPENALHARVFCEQARVWRALGNPPLLAWAKGTWSPLSHTTPPDRTAVAALDVGMAQGNEFRAAAFNLSNSTDEEMSLRLRITGLPGGANPDYLAVAEVAWTDSSGGQAAAMALVPAAREGGDYVVKVESGLTRQVWLTFHSRGVRPGRYAGRIEVAGGPAPLAVPLALRIYPVRFPDAPTLHLGGFDYTNRERFQEITPENREGLIAYLREHFVDTAMATAEVMPAPGYSADGAPIIAPDTRAFDEWIARWPGARQYFVYVLAGGEIGGSAVGTPLFARKVDGWIRFWAEHAQAKGIKPEQLLLLLLDEPASAAQESLIVAWANPIQAAATGARILEDPGSPRSLPALLEVVDVHCLDRQTFLAKDASDASLVAGWLPQRPKRELAFYSALGAAPLLDPYSYYRLQEWMAFEYGALGSYFWSFADSGGGSSWRESAATRSASLVPFFLDTTKGTSGKQMEAIREGVEDYEYLALLRQAIRDGEKRAVAHGLLARACALLDEAAGRVDGAGRTRDYSWRAELDRAVADRVRLEVLEMVCEVEGNCPHTANGGGAGCGG